MYHAAPLAIEIIQQKVLEKELRAYYSAVDELRESCQAPQATQLHPTWTALQRTIASIYWHFLNLTPYERGSSTTGILIHHAMLMGVFPTKKLRQTVLTSCLP